MNTDISSWFFMTFMYYNFIKYIKFSRSAKEVKTQNFANLLGLLLSMCMCKYTYANAHAGQVCQKDPEPELTVIILHLTRMS